MSGVYPYCVVTAGCHPPPGLTGLGGRPVEGRDVEPFTIWTSAEASPPALDLEGITRHHDVVRAASESVTPLPVRFGDWARDHSVLADRIRRRRGELEAALSAVSGCVELGIRLEHASAEPEAGASVETPAGGRAYLRELSHVYVERRRRRGERDALLERLRAALTELTTDERVRYLRSPGLVSVAHLVARDCETRYRNSVAAFASEHDQAARVLV
ncbi:MAG TPA: GvpL/GvpF family gas vesicle protein, partial [Longimicrobiales bacterium]|nr:GvpL/GvpF family gas vesicle protein [Longimicrobiales bacterium]